MRNIINFIRLDHETVGEAVLRVVMMSCAGIIAAITFGMSLGLILIHMTR